MSVAILGQALSAYGAALRRTQAEPASVAGAVPGFASLLRAEADATRNSLHASEAKAVEALTGRASLQESLLHTAEVREAIHRTLDGLSPVLEIYDTVRMTQHAPKHLTAQQICYLDDRVRPIAQRAALARDRRTQRRLITSGDVERGGPSHQFR